MRGAVARARAVCLRADALGLRSLEFYLLAGWCCFGVGKLEEAEHWMRRAVDAAPDAPQSHFNLGVVLQAQQRHEDAAASFERALSQGSGDFDVLVGLGSARLAVGELASAESYFRRALTLDDRRVVAWSLLGSAVGRQCRYPEALELLAHADDIASGDADDATAFTSLAIALTENGRNPEALALYERNLPRFPTVDSHYAYALALLREGRLLEGWRHYEFRWLRADAKTPEAGWLGGPGLVRADAARQDDIDSRRARIRRRDPVRALCAAGEGVGRNGPAQSRAPDEDPDAGYRRESIGYSIATKSFRRMTSISICSACRAFSAPRSTRFRRTFPISKPTVPARNAGQPRLPLGGALSDRAGVGGKPRTPERSFSVDGFVAAEAGVGGGWGAFCVAAEGAGGTDGWDVAGRGGLDGRGAELEDFSDTAALISELDLVLCVDTAVGHLAGALGKPAWVMVAQPADFRWLEGREDSPWYPTLRLFRQSRRDDWTDVVERVKAALEERVREGPAVMPAKTSVKAVTSAPLPWTSPAQLKAGHRPGMSAVAETRVGILQYLPDEPIVGDAIGWYGEYLQAQLDLLARLVRPGSTMLEVGAGVGAHAVFLGRLLGEGGHLFLYESRPVLQRILRQNLAANGVSNVTVMRRTLGSRGEGEGSAGNAPPTTETLDELQLERLDWLKVDASVAALDVLAGASETLWRLRPLLFLAAADEQGLRELAERAREFSYRCWRMETALFDRQNFNRREADIYGGAKALALLAIPEEIEVDIALDECVEIS